MVAAAVLLDVLDESDLVSDFDSGFFSVLVSDFVSVFASEDADVSDDADRLSLR